MTEETVQLLELAAHYARIARCEAVSLYLYEIYLRAARDALREGVELSRKVVPSGMLSPVYCYQCEDWHDGVVSIAPTRGPRRRKGAR